MKFVGQDVGPAWTNVAGWDSHKLCGMGWEWKVSPAWGSYTDVHLKHFFIYLSDIQGHRSWGMGGGTPLPTQHEWRMIIQNMHKSNLKSSEINCFRYPKWPPAVQPCITTPPQKKRRNCKSAPLVTYMIMKSNYCPDSVEMCPFSVKFSWQLSQWHKIWW